jgi:hypothetical protein
MELAKNVLELLDAVSAILPKVLEHAALNCDMGLKALLALRRKASYGFYRP